MCPIYCGTNVVIWICISIHVTGTTFSLSTSISHSVSSLVISVSILHEILPPFRTLSFGMFDNSSIVSQLSVPSAFSFYTWVLVICIRATRYLHVYSPQYLCLISEAPVQAHLLNLGHQDLQQPLLILGQCPAALQHLLLWGSYANCHMPLTTSSFDTISKPVYLFPSCRTSCHVHCLFIGLPLNAALISAVFRNLFTFTNSRHSGQLPTRNLSCTSRYWYCCTYIVQCTAYNCPPSCSITLPNHMVMAEQIFLPYCKASCWLISLLALRTYWSKSLFG
jgi:hypothetical protein